MECSILFIHIQDVNGIHKEDANTIPMYRYGKWLSISLMNPFLLVTAIEEKSMKEAIPNNTIDFINEANGDMCITSPKHPQDSIWAYGSKQFNPVMMEKNRRTGK